MRGLNMRRAGSLRREVRIRRTRSPSLRTTRHHLSYCGVVALVEAIQEGLASTKPETAPDSRVRTA